MNKQRILYTLLAGFGLQASFAPLGLWPLSYPCLAYFIHLLNTPTKEATLLGYVFGLAFFSSGLYWISYSIHYFGHFSWILSIALCALLVAYLSIYPAGISYFISRYKIRPVVIVLPLLWILFEYIRSHLFTGFPWLLLGYSHVDSPLQHYAAYLGVYGVSGLVLFVGYCTYRLSQSRCFTQCALWLALPILLHLASPHIHWTHPSAPSSPVRLVQAVIKDKWHTPLSEQIKRYLALSQPTQHPLVIWPEAALPSNQIPYLVTDLNEYFKTHHSTLITGIMRYHHKQWHNGIRLLGQYHGTLDKRKLVPFGEYIPSGLQTLFQHWSLPMSQLQTGSLQQQPLKIGAYSGNFLICYEIIFPELVRKLSTNSQFLVVLTDSHWFRSIVAAAQLRQMTQMRASELQKPALYIDNSGLSAKISSQGVLVTELGYQQIGALDTTLTPYTGHTPYQRYGITPWVALLLLVLLIHRAMPQGIATVLSADNRSQPD